MESYKQKLSDTLNGLAAVGLAKKVDYTSMSDEDAAAHFMAACDEIDKATINTQPKLDAFNAAVIVYNAVETKTLKPNGGSEAPKVDAGGATAPEAPEEPKETATPPAAAKAKGKTGTVKAGGKDKAPAKVAAAKKVAAPKKAKAKGKARSKPNRKPGGHRDMFGFLIGTKNHETGKMLQRAKGVSMLEIVNAAWNENKETKYNIINALIDDGMVEKFTVKEERAARYRVTEKAVKAAAVMPPAMTPSKPATKKVPTKPKAKAKAKPSKKGKK